jgi:negative regulator of flagellin synthesis FlgM
MIDGVGKSGSNPIDVARGAEKGGRVAAVGDKAQRGRSSAVESAVFELVSAGAPIDTAKVASVRAAIAEGRYAIDPHAIADKMVSLDLAER